MSSLISDQESIKEEFSACMGPEAETTFHYCWREKVVLNWLESTSPCNYCNYSLKWHCCTMHIGLTKNSLTKSGFDHSSVLESPLRLQTQNRICRPFKEPRNQFPAQRAGTTTLFDVPARQPTQACGINSLEWTTRLLKRLHIRDTGYIQSKVFAICIGQAVAMSSYEIKYTTAFRAG